MHAELPMKIRAWDKRAKKMYFPCYPCCCEILLDRSSFAGNNNSINDRHNEVELMFSVGNKKDNENNLLFQGDYIAVYNWGVHTKEELICIAEIVWDDDELAWSWVSPEGYYSSTDIFDIDMYDRWRNVKRIGNIYENTFSELSLIYHNMLSKKRSKE